MRIHTLEITAFGPFAGTEIVDFGPLNDAGVFLLTGQTGAGKTTILDAICFGLFGSVPGGRNSAKDLKSHHAAAEAVPTVVLDVTLRGRRLRLRRSPAWARPSRRARAGHVDQVAKALVEELVDGSWVTRATRLDEAGLLVTRVLGMNREQFCQVVMLPQGLFQTFLRSGAKERHDVLESLFETRRFASIEAWLVEQRRSRDRALESRETTICQLLTRANEVCTEADETFEGLLGRESFTSAEEGLQELLQRTEADAFTARQHEAVAETRLKRAQHALDGGRELSDRQHRRECAIERLRELQAVEGVVLHRGERVRRAEAARSVAPLLDLLADRAEALAAARDRVTQLAPGCPDVTIDPYDIRAPADVDSAASRLRATAGRLEAATTVERAVDGLTAALSIQERELTVLESRRDARREVATSVPALLTEARKRLRQVSTLAATEPVARATVAQAEERSSGAERATRAGDALTTLQESLRGALEHKLQVQSHWLDLRELRLRGMAAELAGQLSDGVGCLVCGNPDHPAPAVPTAEPVTAAAETAALSTFQSVEAEHQTLLAAVAQSRAELASASALAAGLSPTEASAAAHKAAGLLGEAREAQLLETALLRQIGDLDKRRAQLDNEVRSLDTECALRADRLRHGRSELATKRQELAEALGKGARADDTLKDVRARLAATVSLAEALHDHVRRTEDAAEAGGRLSAALAPTPFACAEDVKSAVTTEADIAVAAALNRTYEADRRDATRVVDDPVLVAAAGRHAPDLLRLESRVEECADLRMAARTAADNLARRRDRLVELVTQLDDELSLWWPALEQRDLAASIAALCAGTAAENATKTRLSHYVLAARLEQVVAAANTRLTGICGGRYQLQHSMERGVGDTRGGLGLLVLDTYTGQRRDPATLSGGETFYVSLALALGLADLVRDETSGAELSTLFVDEGFGTLDTETLDEVMDELDSLRSGGRCVGIVSHLSDLRVRIPAQLKVEAGQHGSLIGSR